jgi:hypothetical protein
VTKYFSFGLAENESATDTLIIHKHHSLFRLIRHNVPFETNNLKGGDAK